MLNRRLFSLLGGEKKFLLLGMFLRWGAFLCGTALTLFLSNHTVATRITPLFFLTLGGGILCRALCEILAGRMIHRAASSAKSTLRQRVFEQMLSLDHKPEESALVQLAGEGIDQLEPYFSRYVPQLGTCLMTLPVSLLLLAYVTPKVAVLLLLCVPVIPLSILLVKSLAKKRFQHYWGSYQSLGHLFLENLQGLTTLKLFGADARVHAAMNQTAETFRRATMRVLTMQLQSITIMDVVACGGAALGILAALRDYALGQLSMIEFVAVVLLCTEFFLPLRQLGSSFHVAMNGNTAARRLFDFFDTQPTITKRSDPSAALRAPGGFHLEQLSFAYQAGRAAVQNLTLTLPAGSCTAFVGRSGSGKSTLAALLAGEHSGYTGRLDFAGGALAALHPDERLRHIALLGPESVLFRGTVRENLRINDATDDAIRRALCTVQLWDEITARGGLDAIVSEAGANFSGGQRQRFALARVLLFDCDVMIFDEITSQVDLESEEFITEALKMLTHKNKTIILISHRLQNIQHADRIYVLDHGQIAEHGTHRELLERRGCYHALWETQQALEQNHTLAI